MERLFDELKVSTRTIIATAKVDLDIVNIFEKVSMMPRRFHLGKSDHTTHIDTMYYKNKMRVYNCKDTIQNMSDQKSFRNALNVIMMIDNTKKVNFKVSKNGKFQITGCKELNHAKVCVFSFLDTLAKHCPEVLTLGEDRMFHVYFEIVMTNVDCGTGYCIDRAALDAIVNGTTPYHSLLETSFGYTGVNIKLPVQVDWCNLDVPVIRWNSDNPDDVHEFKAPLSSVSNNLKEKKKFNTFLVFHSGQFIMSGMKEETMRDDYYRFIGILKEHQERIREVLDT